MSDKPVKVYDRRIFNRSGELRDEFRHLDDDSGVPGDEAATATAAAPSRPPEPKPEPAPTEPVSPIAAGPAEAPPPVAGYPDRGSAGGPGVMDLIGLLAEPASLYLREAGGAGQGTLAADSQAEQNLELARLHIDLLAVLREKTAGHLDLREKAVLDNAVYQLQLAYVEMTR